MQEVEAICDRVIIIDRGAVVADDKASTLRSRPVSYTHLRAHETVLDLVCRLLLEKKKNIICYTTHALTKICINMIAQ